MKDKEIGDEDLDEGSEETSTGSEVEPSLEELETADTAENPESYKDWLVMLTQLMRESKLGRPDDYAFIDFEDEWQSGSSPQDVIDKIENGFDNEDDEINGYIDEDDDEDDEDDIIDWMD